MRLLHAGLLTALGLSSASAATIDDLYAALETSNTRSVTSFVADYYRDAGISVNPVLEWQFQAFDKIVNWYNQNTQVIMLSTLPQSADEVAAYWDNWSDVLTRKRWAWRSFFNDDAEAAVMASFNQFLLAAHEFGHALTYRYDPEHHARGDYEINCREYPADRLTAALLDELAEKDARIASLRQRYRLLIDAINAEVPPEHRYDLPAFEVLDADCKVMVIEQPTDDPESMVPYASAFFVRHALLQARDLPPLAEVYENHLFRYWRERQPPPSGRAGTVTTIRTLEHRPGRQQTGLEYGSTLFAFTPDGEIYLVEAGHAEEGTAVTIALNYGELGQPAEVALPPQHLEGVVLPEFGFFDLMSAIAFGPDRFAVMTGTEFGGAPALVIELRRTGTSWSKKIVDLVPDPAAWPDLQGSALAFDAAGTPYAFVSRGSAGWTRIRLDPETLEPGEAVTFGYLDGRPIAVGAGGESFLAHDHQIVSVAPTGAVTAFAGNQLQGFKDNADPLAAEFAMFGLEAYPSADGLNVLDYDPAAGLYVIRHVAFADPVN